MRTIEIYDTTLRDGTQGEGVSLSVNDKLRIAEKLDDFGVDYIEGGWPGSNPKDIDFFAQASQKNWRHSLIAAFGSTRRAGKKCEQDRQVEQLLKAETPLCTIVGKSWDFQVSEILRVGLAENLAMIAETVSYLKKHGRKVFLDAEHFFDGFKNNSKYALSCLRAAQDGGADAVVLCDTNGGAMPSELAEICREVKAAIEIDFGIHTHDDSGVGVANAIAAVRAGASHAQGTINGYGERVGNCNLTTLMPNLALKLGFKINGKLGELSFLARYVDEIANQAHNARAPFVGRAAFSHKGGLHADAVRKASRSYEHIKPEEVGNSQRILISELSGASNISSKARELEVDLDAKSEQGRMILQRVKELENKGYEFEAAEASFYLLMQKELGHDKPLFDLLEYHCSYRHRNDYITCEATVKLSVDGKKIYTVDEGDGPVNALDRALRKALTPFYPQINEISLSDYKVRIIDSHRATAAKTRVLVQFQAKEKSWGAVGVSENVIQASWRAIVDGFKYYLRRYYQV